MKQRMFTVEIEHQPTREERKRRRWCSVADRIYAVVTAAAAVAALGLAIVGIGYLFLEGVL